ncbi:hypothetical protein MMC21_001084 [Puttea exsequens]|nr:hypothetical protein [Puttea exsequens]
MPRTKKRQSEHQLYEAIPNVQQLCFPASRRTVKDRGPEWSAPSKYQQTITQMNPFFDVFHPNVENENLEYEGDMEVSHVPSPVGRKRRKITPEKPTGHKIKTRSAKHVDTKEEPALHQRESGNTHPAFPRAKEEPQASTKSLAERMPPFTPRSLKRREIPSSQSPADTPLSTQKPRSTQDLSRSPLRERSTNVRLGPPSSNNVPRWKNRMIAADSLETEEGDESPPLPGSLFPSLDSKGTGPREAPPNGRCMREMADSSQVKDGEEEGRVHQDRVNRVIDSDEDEDVENTVFDANTDTQANLFSADQSFAGSNQRDALGLFPSKLIEFEPETNESQTDHGEYIEMEKECDEESSVKIDALNAPAMTSRSEALERRSDSVEASVQLQNDLRRDTQAGGLETESQFEIGWNTCYQSDLNIPSSDSANSLSSPSNSEGNPSALLTIPTQILPPRPSAPSRPFKHAVPPSQATTVDITQPTPRRPIHSPHNPQALHNNSPRPRNAFSPRTLPSSPPPIPPPSSSPAATRRARDLWMGFDWNGERLTDSQLLPESLMNDSLAGPSEGLEFSQESLGEDL